MYCNIKLGFRVQGTGGSLAVETKKTTITTGLLQKTIKDYNLQCANDEVSLPIFSCLFLLLQNRTAFEAGH